MPLFRLSTKRDVPTEPPAERQRLSADVSRDAAEAAASQRHVVERLRRTCRRWSVRRWTFQRKRQDGPGSPRSGCSDKCHHSGVHCPLRSIGIPPIFYLKMLK